MESIFTNLESQLKNTFLSILDKINFFFDSWRLQNIPLTILDVLLTALVVYWLWIILKETKIARIGSIIITLIILLIIGRFFNLTTLNWLLRYLLIVLAVAIPIIFQQELRQAFEKFARGKSARTSSAIGTTPAIIDQIIEAVKIMAHHRIGGLVVIKRGDDLSEFTQNSTLLDGKISSELILSIFASQSPLHDGAIIIQEQKIIAAACMLPLDNEQYPEYQLGARHRAALGITGMTDALAIVISAEKGTISLADGGVLDVDISPAELRRALIEGIKK